MQADSTEIELLGMLGQAQRIRGKTKFQKLAYFLQEGERVPLDLNFRMHHYGPYSPGLETCLQRLQMRGLVDLHYTSIDGPVLIDAAQTGLKIGQQSANREKVDSVLEKLGGKLPKQLELLATVHYLAGATGYDGSPGMKERLIRAVKAWKEERFNRGQISSAVDELGDLGYLG